MFRRPTGFLGARTPAIAALAALLVAVSVFTGSVQAQIVQTPPIRATYDPNGVDLVGGGFNPTTQDLTVGKPGAGGLAYGRTFLGSTVNPQSVTWLSTLDGSASFSGSQVVVNIGTSTETFTLVGSTYYSAQGSGATLTVSGAGPIFTYTVTERDGSVYLFQALSGQLANPSVLVQATHPSGEVDTYTYTTGTFTSSGASFAPNRLQSVTNNFGYQLQIQYATNTLNSDGSNFTLWQTRTVVTGINNAVDYCSPSANSCSGFTVAWPTVTYGAPGASYGSTVTDALSRTTTFLYSATGQITSVQLPSGLTKIVTYDGNGRVASFFDGAGTWTYSFSVSGSIGAVVVTDPNSHSRTVVSDLTLGVVTSDTNALSHTTSYGHDALGRLTSVTLPEGNATTYTYDSTTLGTTRGNVTTVTRSPKSGSGLTATSTSAAYDSTCSAPAKCNQPYSTTDANGKSTSYTYDATYGTLLTVTPPVPTTGAVQPQTRLSYTLLYAHYKNSAGSVVAAATPVDLLTGVSACQTTAAASCPGTADEAKSTVIYGSTTSSVANNLLPTSASSGAGDGSLTATASMTYDPVGNVASTVGPLGSGQTSVYLYDADRELRGVIGPNPGGTEGLPFPASRLTYSADGLVIEREQGTDTTQADSNFSTFTSLRQWVMTPDAVDRPLFVLAGAAGSAYNISQFSYDAASRPTCSAQRMNSADWGSFPASACTPQSTGSSGPDRITVNAYDAADQPTQLTVASATTAQATYVTRTYSNNGLVKTLLDADNNLTTYTYDGFDRLSQVTYPSLTQGAGTSNPGDYESYTYDANDNALTDHRRSGDTITFTYDALNRVTEKAVPSWSGQNVFYGYDLLSRVTFANYVSTTGTGVSFAYDALSRKTTETSAGFTMGSQYDAAGDRTRITWPDGFYASYVFDNLTRPVSVTGFGVGTLGTYTWDGLGELTGIARGGNPATTAYTYDPIGRLATLTQGFATSTNNVTWTYGYDVANGQVTRSATNDAYTSHPPVQSQTYTTNGLNQYAAVSGTSYTYDGRGNLASDS
ncbi:MAG TPA: hypothetical protein VGI95_05790, partial [Caulobacteraceae bacterium]